MHPFSNRIYENRIQALRRQQIRQLSDIKNEIMDKLEINLTKADEELLEGNSAFLSAKRSLNLAEVRNSSLDQSSSANSLEGLHNNVQLTEKKYNEKMRMIENKKKAFIIRAKKDLSCRSQHIEQTFQIRIDNEEVECSVKHVINLLLNDVCSEFHISRSRKRKPSDSNSDGFDFVLNL